MNKKEYQEFAVQTTQEILDLIHKKNSDYSEGNDPFANFRIAENVGVPTLKGLWIRMEDKFQRVRAFLNRGDLKVEGEGIEDAFRDTIGYSLLALGIIEEQKRREKKSPSKPIMHIHEPGAYELAEKGEL